MVEIICHIVGMNNMIKEKFIDSIKKKYPNIIIEEFHRFEGATDYEDMAIIYVIETENGIKGTVIDAFGTYANADLGEFLKQVKIK